MLSPPDIDQLLQFALAQGNYGTPSNAYVGMVAPNGMHYVIQFNGNYNDALVTFSQDDLKNLKNKYTELASDLTEQLLYGTTYINSIGSINQKGVEKLFFEALKNMNLQGKINLQKIDDNAVVYNVTQNSNGTTSSFSCP